MRNSRGIGLILVVVGIALSNYGFFHDLIWDKHDGAIYMGLRSYLTVGAGLVVLIAGIWRISCTPRT